MLNWWGCVSCVEDVASNNEDRMIEGCIDEGHKVSGCEVIVVDQ